MYPVKHQLLAWILLLPLLGALLNGFLGRRLGRAGVQVVGSGAILASFLVAVGVFWDLLGLVPQRRRLVQDLYNWAMVGGLSIDVRLVIDPLSMLLVLIITGVGFLIHLYSTEYMEHDPSIHRYFAYLNLFVFSMLILVMGGSLPLMFVGWEGVGLCSYLLIGFWFSAEANARAGRKAFIVNRIGDFGFILGMFFVYKAVGTLDFGELAARLSSQRVYLAPMVVTAATMLLFVGATGKSAQIPLFIWLPDAMAGPTPVSALIHAATMVTAGVYMIARLAPLYVLAPTTMGVIAGVGAATALLAALIAMTQTDIKKVLAYSTVSQLGFMFVGVGVGAFVAGVFHLMTHAFFKALLFLGSGSVIHAMQHANAADDPQDIRKMGGLWSKMPITAATFLVGTAAICGVPLLSGFFSKDEILWKALSSHLGDWRVWLAASVAATCTAFYMTRLFVLTFLGEFRGRSDASGAVHESGWRITVPLMVLAVLAALGGYLGLPHVFHLPNLLDGWLAPVFSGFTVGSFEELPLLGLHIGEWTAMATSVVLAAIGIGAAWQIYHRHPESAARLAARLRPLHTLSLNKFYVDQIYDALVVRPLHSLSRGLLFAVVDRRLIDATVEAVGGAVRSLGGLARLTQTGQLTTYILYLVAGSLAVMIALAGGN